MHRIGSQVDLTRPLDKALFTRNLRKQSGIIQRLKNPAEMRLLQDDLSRKTICKTNAEPKVLHRLDCHDAIVGSGLQSSG